MSMVCIYWPNISVHDSLLFIFQTVIQRICIILQEKIPRYDKSILLQAVERK